MTLMQEAPVAELSSRARPDMADEFDAFDPPEGFRAELIGGALVLSPTSLGFHHGLLRRLTRQFLEPKLPDGTEVTTFPVTVWLPETPDGRSGYVPDLAVMNEEATWDTEHWKFPADVFHLVVEVVSANAQSQVDDRIRKPLGYASGPVPLYLLIDPLKSEVALYSEPKDGRYRTLTRVEYGDKIAFPEPFGGVLDTSIFLH
jgi:Uma2 family endonuclease